MNDSVDALIIGAGLTGLSTARLLADRGLKVAILEKSSRSGGVIQTQHSDGFLCEKGPNSMMIKSWQVQNFIKELGIEDQLVDASTEASKRFLVKNGKIVALPQSPMAGITTPLYRPSNKFRLLGEPFRKPSTKEEESVAEFVSRRMGPDFLEYGIAALVSGIFAGDPDKLSIRYAFPKVWNLEQNYGSLIGGALKLKRERKKSGETPFKSRMVSFRQGLSTLIQALENDNRVRIFHNSQISSIDAPDSPENPWKVQFSASGERSSIEARQLVLATPVHVYPKLPFPENLASRLKPASALPYVPVSTLILGFKREDINHPLDGFGVLMPRVEKRFVLGSLFSSSLFPGRAPEGYVNLMNFIGGALQRKNADLPESELIAHTLKDLEGLLGIRGKPVFTQHTLWPRAIPQYNVGHGKFLDLICKVEQDTPNLTIAGNFLQGPGLNDCIENAYTTADKITKQS